MSEDDVSQAEGDGEILEVAKRMATTGDRWFVSFARTLGRAAGRVKKETDIVADSAKAAAATTGRVTSKMAHRMKPSFIGARSTGKKTDTGTSDDLLKAIAVHYSVEEKALRSNRDARETIELLHGVCLFHILGVNDGPKPEVDPSTGAHGSTSSMVERQPEIVPPEVEDPKSAGAYAQTEPVEIKSVQSTAVRPESAQAMPSADSETMARQARKRRGAEPGPKRR